jgi:hypothetical protein
LPVPQHNGTDLGDIAPVVYETGPVYPQIEACTAREGPAWTDRGYGQLSLGKQRRRKCSQQDGGADNQGEEL